MTKHAAHTDEVMGERYAKAASERLGYPVQFVGWFKQQFSGATEPEFAVSREHFMDAYRHGLCVRLES